MRKKSILTISGIILLPIVLLSVNSISSTYDASIKKVLVVHSCYPQYAWGSFMSRGIKKVFENAKNVQVETFYMNIKDTSSRKWKQESGKWAREIISQWNPDIVITVDDNAQEYVGRYYAEKNRPKIVFCGGKNKSEQYGYPASNITGVLERHHTKETLDLLNSFVPGVKKNAVISDNTPAPKDAMEHQNTAAKLKIPVSSQKRGQIDIMVGG